MKPKFFNPYPNNQKKFKAMKKNYSIRIYENKEGLEHFTKFDKPFTSLSEAIPALLSEHERLIKRYGEMETKIKEIIEDSEQWKDTDWFRENCGVKLELSLADGNEDFLPLENEDFSVVKAYDKTRFFNLFELSEKATSKDTFFYKHK
jgi:hypothetical protein